ncbi:MULTISPECIES: hypothetical protein [Streptacidiphilus]|uniref:Uncharacterized protein n=1 Tax=Streptacidiphilus cavernicola TaxID=3342716 RepID=A0ABV6UVV7_9ACTN|nr:hypothetical protein [Streptacidiphilus jeojiense]
MTTVTVCPGLTVSALGAKVKSEITICVPVGLDAATVSVELATPDATAPAEVEPPPDDPELEHPARPSIRAPTTTATCRATFETATLSRPTLVDGSARRIASH